MPHSVGSEVEVCVMIKCIVPLLHIQGFPQSFEYRRLKIFREMERMLVARISIKTTPIERDIVVTMSLYVCA